MRNWTLAAVAIATVFVVAAPAKNAAAMPVATPGQLAVAADTPGALEKTVLVCGPWACYWRPGSPLLVGMAPPMGMVPPMGMASPMAMAPAMGLASAVGLAPLVIGSVRRPRASTP